MGGGGGKGGGEGGRRRERGRRVIGSVVVGGLKRGVYRGGRGQYGESRGHGGGGWPFGDRKIHAQATSWGSSFWTSFSF